MFSVLIKDFELRDFSGRVFLGISYRQFHKTLPRSSAFVNWISVWFHETGCIRKYNIFYGFGLTNCQCKKKSWKDNYAFLIKGKHKKMLAEISTMAFKTYIDKKFVERQL